MIQSMTGFARAENSGEWGELTWELRSVNHRYLDVHLRLPEGLRGLEPDIRDQVARALGRGKVDCSLRLQEAQRQDRLEVDADRLSAVARVCEQVRQSMPEAASPDSLSVLQWPGVLKQAQVDNEALGAAALDTLKTALKGLAEARAGEGERLEEILRDRCDGIAERVRQVRARLPEVRVNWEEKIRSRLDELDQPVDPGRLEQEIIIFAQRMDVDEELSRLEAHLKNFAKALKAREPVGRRMDFLMQEFNREANTLGSKSQDPEISSHAVEMKVLIEQMREQVQNIE